MTAHRDTINAHNAWADENKRRHLLADGAQLDLNDLTEWLRTARSAKMHGKWRMYAAALKQYRHFLFHYMTVCEVAERNGWKDPIFQPQPPLPIREQLVGLSAEERRALEWKPYD